jgi:sulfate adenylyltransferase
MPSFQLWADAATAASLTQALPAWPAHVLTADQAAALLRLLDGVYAPLDGFMTAATAARVAATQALEDGSYWPAPVILDVPPALAEQRATTGPLVLREAEGRAVAVMPEATAWQEPAGWRIGGRVVGLQAPPAYDLADLRLSPAEVRDELARRGWRDAIAVPVAGRLDAADVAALEALAARHDAALVVFPTRESVAIADRALYARMRALRAALATASPNRALLVLDTRPVADGGPGSPADAILARAHGCARLVTWGPAADGLRSAADHLGLALDTLVPAAPTSEPDEASTPLPGVTIFFTGLSGSGKSTIANALRVRLLEDGRRTVTLLDGDLVRQHLSSELGFSREHRTLNVRRIAFVAAEITRHGGLAICAPIAPYAALRREARALVEAVGTFLLVYVATPIAICEARDVKGLYRRARAGALPEFTGVSDPYDVPDDAELVVDTSETTVAEAVDRLMAALDARGLLTGPTR